MKQQNPVHPVRAARLHHGWTQQHLADFAQVSLSSVIRAEQGLPLRVDISSRLAKALGRQEPHEVGLLSIGERVEVGEQGWREEPPPCEPEQHPRRGLALSAGTTSGQFVPPEVESQAAMNRRDVFHYLGGAGVAVFTSSLALPAVPEAQPGQSKQQASAPLPALNDETVRQFESLLAACWGLSGGNLSLVEHILPSVLTRLEALVQHPSVHQKTLLKLIAICYKLTGTLAMHRLHPDARVQYSRLAVRYARLSEESAIHAGSLISMAHAYYYSRRPVEMLQAFQESLSFADDLSSLQRARLNVGAADAYALCGQKQEALRCLGNAFEGFFQAPENKNDAFYLDTGIWQFYLWSGITYIDLGQPQQALKVLTQVEQPNVQPFVPERIRLELLNQKARAVLALRDMEQSLACVQQGVQGARTLGSEKRYSEASETYQLMCLAWPRETRVRQLADVFHVGA